MLHPFFLEEKYTKGLCKTEIIKLNANSVRVLFYGNLLVESLIN